MNDSLPKKIDLRKKTEIERESVINSLKNALVEIKVLEGMLPICMHCKKIRDDSGYWNQLETYIHEHSGADLAMVFVLIAWISTTLGTARKMANRLEKGYHAWTLRVSKSNPLALIGRSDGVKDS